MNRRRATLMLMGCAAMGIYGTARAETEISVYYNPS